MEYVSEVVSRPNHTPESHMSTSTLGSRDMSMKPEAAATENKKTSRTHSYKSSRYRYPGGNNNIYICIQRTETTLMMINF